jgi:hypothetical protein
MIEDADERRVFRIDTNKHTYVLRTLKSEGKRDIKEDAISWTTTLSLKTINGLQKNYKNGIRNVVALVLVNSKVLSNSANHKFY